MSKQKKQPGGMTGVFSSLSPALARPLEQVNLTVELAPRRKIGLPLKNPVITSSGTFGYGTEYTKLLDVQRLGAIVSKGTTLYPRQGNSQLRVVETAAGMLNAIGLQNAGIADLIAHKAPVWANWKVPVLVNIAGETLDEFIAMAEMLEGVPGIAGLELNVSCPNLKAGGSVYGSDAAILEKVTGHIRDLTSLPLLVKLSPMVASMSEAAAAVEAGGADAVSLINTVPGMKIDIKTRRPALGNITGGLSGPAIKPIALKLVYEAAQAIRIPVVGIGGIATAEDALEFIMAGATAIEVGTINFVNPRASLDILEGIEAFLKREGVPNLTDLIGVALPSKPNPAALEPREDGYTDKNPSSASLSPPLRN